MLDIEIEDLLVEKIGGKLRLTSLMQKRMVELKRGARPLVEMDRNSHLVDIIVQEILQDKIELAPLEECDTSFLEGTRRVRRDQSDGEREIYGSDLRKIKEQRIKELSALLNPTKK
ncbi:MAG: hypothetical protein V3T77_06885 [Planctomycetota bacterium]